MIDMLLIKERVPHVHKLSPLQLSYLSGLSSCSLPDSLVSTVMGLAFISPLFVIFRPVLVPAAIVIGLAVAGFLTSGAFGVTGISSIAWIANYVRRSPVPEYLEYATRRAEKKVDHAARRAREAAEEVQNKAQDTAAENDDNRGQESGQREKNKAQDEGRESGQKVKNKTQEQGKASS